MSDLLTTLRIRDLGIRDYHATWRSMQDFTQQRTLDTVDEVWLVQHPAVFTLGLNGDPAHIIANTTIPVVNTDRGGQVTYHGPGQLVFYPLLDLARRQLGVKQYVAQLEQSVIDLLHDYAVSAARRPNAPGVYVAGAKIAALGLRIRRGRSYHGLALNHAMDLSPFTFIHPCGYANLAVTQMADLISPATLPNPAMLRQQWLAHFRRLLGYNISIPATC